MGGGSHGGRFSGNEDLRAGARRDSLEHLSADVAVCAVDLNVVDEPQIHDVHRDLGIEDLPKLAVDVVGGGHRRFWWWGEVWGSVQRF